MKRWRELVKHQPVSVGELDAQRRQLRIQLALSSPTFDPASLDLKRGFCGAVICEDPVIILTANPFFEVVESVIPYYKDRTVYFFVGMLWTLTHNPEYRRQYKEKFSQIVDKHPNIKISILANDVKELIIVRDMGIPAELVNHNAFIDESIFDIFSVEQTFDAVYNARMIAYKRHFLAQGIKALKLIMSEATQDHLAHAKRLLPGCTVANQQGDGVVSLNPHEVAHHLNTAKCGLCLSSFEGAMFASAEYLLCGLPVVSTRNAGGRNWFFSNDYVIYCDDEVEAVTAAVARIVREPISRQLIRESVLQKIKRERLVFFDFVDRIFREIGQPSRRIQPEFEKRFFDKLNYAPIAVEGLLLP